MGPCRCIDCQLQRWTDEVIAFRVIHTFNRGMNMAPLIEIKGLAASIATAKKGIADVRGASASLNVSSAALVAELNDVTAQIESARSDLKFEAATLGNGNGETEEKPLAKPLTDTTASLATGS